jgi:transcriptional regulator with XRE-family HTH domain
MGLRQTDVAREIGVVKTCISEYESQKSSPGVETLQKIGHFFGVSLDEILTDRIDAPRAERIVAQRAQQKDFREFIQNASLPTEVQTRLARINRIDMVTMMNSDRYAVIKLAKEQRQLIEELEEEHDKSAARVRDLADRLDRIQEVFHKLGIDVESL